MSAYNFVDTTQPSPAIGRPAEAVCFNGVWLDDEINGFRTLNVQGREVADKEPDTYDIAAKYGEAFRKAHYPPRTITVTYQLTAATDDLFREYYNELNGLLSAEQAQLIFWDEPDKYFVATKATNSEVDPGVNCVTGWIEFLCADPLKYSTTLKEFTATVNDEGTLEADVINSGTAETSINYTITHNAENGYIGIISDEGIIQLGKPEEIDGYTYERSEVLTTPSDFRKFDPDGWEDDAGPNCWSSALDTSGSLSVSNNTGDTVALYLSQTGTKGGLTGGQKSFKIVDSNGDEGAVNFYAYANTWFEAGIMGQTGAQVFAFADEDNELICAQVVYKIDNAGNTAKAAFYVGGNTTKLVAEQTFQANSRDDQNPYNEPRGHSAMKKEGERIEFYWWGSNFSVRVPELAEVKVDKVQLFIGQYDGMPLDNRFVTRNYYREVTLMIMNVEKWQDIVNRYQPSDVIYIDGETTKIYVNGMIRMEDEVLGSKYFKAHPGTTKIQFVYSDFCESPPTIKATIREAYL